MEWQQLEYFYVVAMLQHFTRAAEQLSISQPALSRSIGQLENELGVALFDRQGRSVILNSFGQSFFEHTSRILQEMKEAKRDVMSLQNPDYGDINLAFLKSLGISFIPRMVRTYLNLNPAVNFQLFQNSTENLIMQLKRGEIDLCISSHTETSPEIEWIPLWNEEMFIFVHLDHPFALKEHINLIEILNEKFVVLKQGYGSRAILDEMFIKLNRHPNISFEGEEVVSLLGFVAEDLGIALLPKISGMNMNGLAKLSIIDYKCERNIGLAWMKDKYLPPVVHKFKQFVIDYSIRINGYDAF
jgi:DNA-binding transcriptional LysR family regulator